MALTDKIDDLKKLDTSLQDYITTVLAKSNLLTECAEMARTAAEAFETLEYCPTLQNIAAAYTTYRDVEICMKGSIEWLQSQGIITRADAFAVRRLINNIVAIWERLVNMNDSTIIWNVLRRAGPEKCYEYVVAQPVQPTQPTQFTIAILEYIISTSPNPAHVAAVRALIEIYKDAALGAGRIPLEDDLHRCFIGAQSIIARYSLVPVWTSCDLRSLLGRLGLDMSFGHAHAEHVHIEQSTPSEYFKDIVDKTGCGVIVLHTGTPSALEFDIKGVVDTAYITEHDLQTKPISGLTNKVITRFTTITRLDAPPALPAQTTILRGRLPIWYIFETIAVDKWRLLASGDKYPVPSDKITGLYGEGDDRPQLCPTITTRPTRYSDVQSQTILSACFVENPSLRLNDYTQRAIPSTEPTRNAIATALMKWYDSQTNVKSALEFRGLVDRAHISNIIADVIHSGARHADEAELSYLCQLETLISIFAKELERRVYMEVLPTRFFTEYPESELNAILRAAWQRATHDTIAELERTGAWADYGASLKLYLGGEKIKIN